MSRAASGRPRIAVVADDLIWGTRLCDAVRGAGAVAVAARSGAAVAAALDGAAGVIVDTSARAYDPLAVIRSAAATGLPVMAVVPHVETQLRRAAREAGAGRVHAYQVLFERGDREIRAWLAAAGEEEADR